MFSKQLEYSYLMYMYLKKNPCKYIFGDEIIIATKVPKRWGKVLLTNMVSKEIMKSAKGKGFMLKDEDISFWDFYRKVEESTKSQLENGESYDVITDNHKKYQDILLKIGIKVREEMMNIKI